MHTEYPRDLFIPIKSKTKSFGDVYIVLPYMMRPAGSRFDSSVFCLRYKDEEWKDPLFDNPKFGLDRKWDTDEWEIAKDIPDKEKLISLIFGKLYG